MKYTKKQLSTIAYLTSLKDKARLAAYKQRIADREKAKKEAREKRKADLAKIAASIKVGDVFRCSWGYEQTNVDFFQVIAKVGKNSVRIRQVSPAVVAQQSTGPMAANYVYEIPSNGELLPPKDWSVFIQDQANGDVKRVSDSCYQNEVRPCIKMRSYAWAFREEPGESKHYVSWYA